MVSQASKAKRIAKQKRDLKAGKNKAFIQKLQTQKKEALSRIAARGGTAPRGSSSSTSKTSSQKDIIIARQRAELKAGKSKAFIQKIEKQKVEARQRIASRRIGGQITVPVTGAGGFTRAIDVGEGRMQDVFVRFSQGQITGRQLLGQPVPQTQRFRERQAQVVLPVTPRPQAGALTISTFKPQEFQLESGFRRGLGGATKAFVTERIPKFVTGLGGAIGPAILGDTRQLREIDPFQAFTEVGPRRGERRVSIPQFGTVTPESTGGFIQTTQFEQLREARRGVGIPETLVGAPIGVIARERATGAERRITQEFQQRVDLGQLTPEVATKAAQKRLEREVQRQTAPLVGLGGEQLRVRRGERISSTVKGLIPAAGLTALSFTPSGAIVGGSLAIAGGSFLATRGRGKIEEGDIAGGIADIGSGALFAAGGFASLGGAAGRLESQILASRIGRLQQQPFRITGRELAKRGDDVLLGVSGRRGVGDFARQQTRSTFAVVPTTRTPAGLQRFSVIGGRAQTRTIVEGLPIRAGGFGRPSAAPIFKDITTATFTARGQVVPSSTLRFSQGFGVRLPKQEFVPSRGVLDIVRGERVVSSPFVGITQPTKDTFRIIGGRAQRAIIERPLRGFAGPTSVQIRGGISGGGIIQRLPTARSITPGSFQILGTVPQPSNIINIGRSLQKSLQTQATGIGATVGKEVVLRTPVIGLAPSVGVSPFAPIISTRAPTRTQQQAGQISIQSPKLTQVVDTTTRSAFLPASISRSAKAQRSRTVSDVAQIVESATATRLRSPQVSRQVQRGIAPAVIIPTITSGVGFLSTVGTGFAFAGGFPSPIFPTFPSGRVPVRGRKRRPGRVAPSLTGLTLFELGDITGGPLPTSGLPLTSFVPESAVRKRKKSKKKKR